MNDVCYDEVLSYVKKGLQVLVFVHARNATANLAQAFRERAAQLGHLDFFTPPTAGTRNYVQSEKSVSSISSSPPIYLVLVEVSSESCRIILSLIQASRNHKLFEFFRFGLGVHHAGLVRHDRLLMERTFHQGHIMIICRMSNFLSYLSFKVLFCTATLAWGVNLPAHAVVIRGTDVFDAEKGQFADLGVLDVQQIFGRAGRPQFENEGHGIIITTQNKLDKYLGMLIRQAPIESQFFKRIHDNLNAEIALGEPINDIVLLKYLISNLGTVSNIDEAVTWLTYTYYYTRAIQNPIAYGLPHTILDKDPDLRQHLTRMVTDVAELFQILTRLNAFVHATDLGRIASNFYIKYETIEMLNETGLPVSLSAFMPDDMVIALISMATEFSQLKASQQLFVLFLGPLIAKLIREEECLDLEELISCGCVLPLRGGGLASIAGKVNVLLQSHISRTFVRSFSLSSESLYVQQNASRLCRGIFEIALRKGWAQAANAFLTMSKSIEKRIREEECLDLEELISCGCVLPLRGGGLASIAGKVNVLLQSHISRTFVRSFSLSSESLYVQQNASRLCRGIFEIALRKGWAQAANAFLTMSKSIEKRVWPTQSSLRQLDEFLRIDLIEKVERRKLTESQLLDLSAKELGYMFSCDGEKLYQTMRMLPRVEVDATLKPITYTIMQVSAILTPAFIWNDRLLGKNGAQSFWLTLENIDENLIVHQERIAINKKKVRLGEPQNLIFTIPIRDYQLTNVFQLRVASEYFLVNDTVRLGEPQNLIFTIPIRDYQLTNVFQLRVASEYFLVNDTVVALSMHNCILPKSYKAHTDLLPLDPLPVKTIGNELFESIYNFSYFNPIQTQVRFCNLAYSEKVFHCLYQTDENVLIGAPTGSGKTLCAELAMFRLLQKYPGKK
ncbi:unnamed protein product, partial [Strongylus vulgaris]